MMPRPSDRTMQLCQQVTDDVLELKGAYADAIRRAVKREDWERAGRFADDIAQRILDRLEAFPHDKVDRHI